MNDTKLPSQGLALQTVLTASVTVVGAVAASVIAAKLVAWLSGIRSRLKVQASVLGNTLSIEFQDEPLQANADQQPSALPPDPLVEMVLNVLASENIDYSYLAVTRP